MTRLCDWCESTSSLVFCRVDSLYLCAGCDERTHHGENKHERVWVCEVCEQAAAVVTCKADSAALCASCDRDIHSANPLARRHDRLPIVPFLESTDSVLNSSQSLLADTIVLPTDEDNKTIEEAEAASWILPNPGGSSNHKFVDASAVAADHDVGFSDLLFGNAAQFLDFDYSIATSLADSVVPVQTTANAQPNHRPSEHSCYELDFSKSKLAPYNDSAQSLSRSVSSDVGVVPENTSVSVSDVSYPFGRQFKVDPAPLAASPVTQLSGSEREARVMRYREKRKNRKFEKTIRYASRKAYAETRPRIKGRFAKRTEMETEVDHACFYSSAASGAAFELANAGYGVVPSF